MSFAPAPDEEAFKQYLGLNKNPNFITKSEYKPTKALFPGNDYYSLGGNAQASILNNYLVNKDKYNFTDKHTVFQVKENDQMWTEEDPFNYGPTSALGSYSLSKGKDSKGDYLSYYDKYDFPEVIQSKMGGKPFEFYDRIYIPKTKGEALNKFGPKGGHLFIMILIHI